MEGSIKPQLNIPKEDSPVSLERQELVDGLKDFCSKLNNSIPSELIENNKNGISKYHFLNDQEKIFAVQKLDLLLKEILTFLK
jgi:hypothetical protein